MTVLPQPLNREEWRPIEGSEGYEVSSLGNVRSWRRIGCSGGIGSVCRTLKLNKTGLGYRTGRPYYAVHIRDRSNKVIPRLVHRLVLFAFVGPPARDGLEARHLNGCSTDNSVNNLAWGTSAENGNDRRRHGTSGSGDMHPQRKVSDEDIRIARRDAEAGASTTDLAARLGVSTRYMRRLIGRQRRCVTA